MNAPDWLMTILTFFVGYAVGKGNITKESIITAEKQVYKSVDKALGRDKKDKVGGINRPSSKQLEKYKNPSKIEEENEMKNLLERTLIHE